MPPEQIIRDNMDKLVFAPSKGSKGGNIEIRKGTDVVVDATPKAPVPSSSDALTDIVLDVEADLEDFE